MVTVQLGAAPLHAPLQLRNCKPAGGVAVRVTAVPALNLAEQALPQLSARSTPEGVVYRVVHQALASIGVDAARDGGDRRGDSLHRVTSPSG